MLAGRTLMRMIRRPEKTNKSLLLKVETHCVLRSRTFLCSSCIMITIMRKCALKGLSSVCEIFQGVSWMLRYFFKTSEWPGWQQLHDSSHKDFYSYAGVHQCESHKLQLLSNVIPQIWDKVSILTDILPQLVIIVLFRVCAIETQLTTFFIVNSLKTKNWETTSKILLWGFQGLSALG